MIKGDLNIPSTVNDPHYRYKMPRIQIATQGSGNGIKTNWVNLPDVSNALKVPLEYPIKFIARELGSSTETKSNSYLINGNHKVEQMQELLDKFIKKYVLCPKCLLPEIHGKIKITKKNEIKATCRSCGFVGKLDSQHYFATYIRSHPPPFEEDKKPEKVVEKGAGKEIKKKIRECCLNLPKVIDDNEPLETNIEKINEFISNYKFEFDCKFYCFAFGVFPEAIYTKSFLNRLPLIKHFIENESEDKSEEALYNFLLGFQDKIFSQQKGVNQKYVSSVLYYLYDKDIIKEDFWLSFLKGSIQEKYHSKFYREDGEKKLKEAAQDFSNWIENGPYEGEEENDKKEKDEKKKEDKKEEKKEVNEIKEEKKDIKEEKDEEDDNEDKGKKKNKKKNKKKKKGKDKEKEDEKKKEVPKEEEKKEEPKEEDKKEEVKEEKKEDDINIDDI